jgi:2,4-dienoyl-CoA reductase-like NADH-dependent reductase (Old Yellow Enzyme family)
LGCFKLVLHGFLEIVMSLFFDALSLGDLSLGNRLVMAPMTRCRADEQNVPTAPMAEYYRLRAGAGLIITEGVPVSPQGVGYPRVPGIWNAAQVMGWRQVTDAVHAAGGVIFAQLWHVGRISDPLFLNGELPVAPSAIAPDGHVSLVRPVKSYVTPRALAANELPGIVDDFRKAAENAKAAGFDGVELHAANGYLLDQFLQDRTNQRVDAYGGSIANRARLLIDVTEAVTGVWGAGRVGVHLAPGCDLQSMGDSNPGELFTYVARELGARRLAFIFTREAQGESALTPAIKKAFGGVLIANQGLDKTTGESLLAAGQADAIGIGVPFIANPDLVRRFRENLPLNVAKPEFFYTGEQEGYLDYPLAA